MSIFVKHSTSCSTYVSSNKNNNKYFNNRLIKIIMPEKIVTFKLDLNRHQFFTENNDGFQAHTHVEFTAQWIKNLEIKQISTCSDGKFLYVTYHYLTNEE